MVYTPKKTARQQKNDEILAAFLLNLPNPLIKQRSYSARAIFHPFGDKIYCKSYRTGSRTVTENVYPHVSERRTSAAEDLQRLVADWHENSDESR